MSRAATITIALVVGTLLGAGGALLGARPGSSTAAPLAGSAFVPSCPRPLYTADGNMRPLFCKIDNPLALKFYARVAPALFTLGANASPEQAIAALRRARGATGQELCSAYLLWAWRWHWKFGIDPVEGVTGNPCS